MKQLNLLAEFDACEPQNAPNDGQDQNGDNGTITNGHEYVDLGLSVKWATCNVGATKPEEKGDLFAWGETAPKSSYSMDNYSYSANLDVLPLEQDATHANWGGAWRMPTDEEWTELREKCTWKWRTVKGIHGYMVKSKINGNSIFLPAAGYHIKIMYREGGYWRNSFDAGYYGYYWSSSLCTDHSHYAWSVDVESNYVSRNYDYRYNGLSIRPVIKID